MRFLADESCDFAVVRALRGNGHDVVAVAEITPRAEDAQVIAWAASDNRILLTEDNDFGQLVFASGTPSPGVILVRFPTQYRRDLPQAILRVVRDSGDRLAGSFVVVQPGRVRFRPGVPP